MAKRSKTKKLEKKNTLIICLTLVLIIFFISALFLKLKSKSKRQMAAYKDEQMNSISEISSETKNQNDELFPVEPVSTSMDLYSNTDYSFEFLHPENVRVKPISTLAGSTQPDTIALFFSEKDRVRIQVYSQPMSAIKSSKIIKKVTIGKSDLLYVEFSGPCNYFLEGKTSTLCIYTPLTPDELSEDTSVGKILRSLRFTN